MHSDFIWPSGTWPSEVAPSSTHWQRFDVAQFKAMNGDGGGAYAPVKPIILGGSPVNLTSAGTAITGGITTRTGGRVKLAANDFPALSSTITDTVIMPITRPRLPNGSVGAPGLCDDDAFVYYDQGGVVGLQTVTTSGGLIIEIPPRYLHKGAALLKMTLRWRARTRSTSLPGGVGNLFFQPVSYLISSSSTQTLAPPQGGISKWAAVTPYSVGAYVIPLAGSHFTGYYYRCTGSGTSGAGEPVWPTTPGVGVGDNSVAWVCVGLVGQCQATTAAAFYNGGQPQAIEYDFDGTGNTIDTTGYRYAISVGGARDVSATDPTQNLILHSLQIDYGNVSSHAFQ